MKKSIYLSVACALALNVYAKDLGTIEVSQKVTTKVVKDVSLKEVKSADLAETLHNQVPSVNLIRRSGIANDIVIRGQKRDNIVVSIDDAIVCGACPNRMDPPTSHVVVSNVDSIVVSEGPFNVENFGSLSGNVKIKTKKPKKGLHGDVYINGGSFGYKKAGATLNGGNDNVKFLITGSIEGGEQYEDGNGNTLADQLKMATDGTPKASSQFADKYHDMDSFEKKTFMAKTFIDITDNQNLELSYTLNRSDNILYPNSKMDAIYDDSDIMNLKYTMLGLGSLSKKLQFKLYNSKVEHPMSTKYRKSSGVNSANEVISELTTDMTGAKIINDAKVGGGIFTVGLDSSKRNWDGEYIGLGAKSKLTGRASINDVDTKNNAIFLKYNKDFQKLNLKVGTRVNDTTITTGNTAYEDRDFDSVDANILTTYKADKQTKYFVGVGQASRVPDGRELYFNSSMNVMSGTPTLDQTTNSELDIGVEKKFENAYLKVKGFYSKLDNYIYFNKNNTKTITVMDTPMKVAHNSFENIDAKIYGIEVMGAYDISDDLYVNYGAVYQRGKKDEALAGQTNTNLADITPLKTNIAINYDYGETLKTKLELVAVSGWENYDSDNGEQAIAGYGVVNIKGQKTIAKNFEVTVGVNNALDKNYAVSNTYADLILLSDGTSGEVMLLNEPGRYIYTNLKYKF